jgi:hypothetical protein
MRKNLFLNKNIQNEKLTHDPAYGDQEKIIRSLKLKSGLSEPTFRKISVNGNHESKASWCITNLKLNSQSEEGNCRSYRLNTYYISTNANINNQ